MQACLPAMRRRGFGRIVNISSIGGKRRRSRTCCPYCASKFALAGLSDAFAPSSPRDDIRVTSVYPGLMRTGSPVNAEVKGQHAAEFTWFALSDSVPGLSISAERAAAQIVDAVQHGVPELVIGVPARLAVVASALAPHVVARLAAIAAQLLPSSRRERGGRRHERRAIPTPPWPRPADGADQPRRGPERRELNGLWRRPFSWAGSTTLMQPSCLSRKVLVHLRGVVEADAVGDDERRVDLALLDALQQRRQVAVHVGLAHLQRQALARTPRRAGTCRGSRRRRRGSRRCRPCGSSGSPGAARAAGRWPGTCAVLTRS